MKVDVLYILLWLKNAQDYRFGGIWKLKIPYLMLFITLRKFIYIDVVVGNDIHTYKTYEYFTGICFYREWQCNLSKDIKRFVYWVVDILILRWLNAKFFKNTLNHTDTVEVNNNSLCCLYTFNLIDKDILITF